MRFGGERGLVLVAFEQVAAVQRLRRLVAADRRVGAAAALLGAAGLGMLDELLGVEPDSTPGSSR
ncbi:MAG: hypothetical protein U1F67_12465 [Rubrivivax sp.]